MNLKNSLKLMKLITTFVFLIKLICLYFDLKETLPPNKNAAFRGYHLPFIGYTYTENSLLNDCHSLIDLINESKALKKLEEVLNVPSGEHIVINESTQINEDHSITTKKLVEYESLIAKLESEKVELITKLNIYQNQISITQSEVGTDVQSLTSLTTITVNPQGPSQIEQQANNAEVSASNQLNNELKQKLEQTQISLESHKEQIVQMNKKLLDMTNLYESAKQNELEEKNKIKHLERSVRALKIEKDQMFAQVIDLQERIGLQAKDLQDAQTQRKLAVQEFTDVNEKVNELRSKNVKLSNDLLNKEDEYEELKRSFNELKHEWDKRERSQEDFKSQVKLLNDAINRLESEKIEALKQVAALSAHTATPTTESSSSNETEVKSAIADDTLSELNVQLNKEIKSLQIQLTENNTQISQLQEANQALIGEIQMIKEKNVQLQRESSSKLKEQIDEIIASKDKEISLIQNEMSKQVDDIRSLNEQVSKLESEKRALEEEVKLFDESKQALSRYDWQMNEILQMVNEEKLVRGHLRSLASKLIEEVDSLRSQSNLSVNGQNGPVVSWKNRCSEKRERINAQNMQIALEKEFQAKEQLIEEINNLKAELDSKQHKISDLHGQIDQVNTDLLKSQIEIKELREDLLAHQKALASTGLSTSGTNHSSHIISSTSTSTFSYSNETNVNHLNSLHLATSSSADMKSSAEFNNHQLIKQQLHSDSSSTNTSGPLLTINTHNVNHTLQTGDLTNVENYADLSSLSVNNPSISSTSNVVKNTNNKSYTNINSNQTVNNVPQVTNGHKFEVVSFQTIERCEYCCGILYGICRQAVRCKGKNCNYLCHPKCRQYLPTNCPININQRVQLKGVDFTRGIGTLMQGNLKVPKIGGVKKGWQDHYVFLSNARLYVCPIVDNKPSLIPSQIIDIRDPQFSVSSVNESDVIHASKRDIPCILKMIVSKLKTPAVRQKLLFCAKDEKEKHNWINVLKDLNERLIQASKQSSNSSSILLPIEAKEICEASSIRNAYSACIYDSERLLIASDEGIDVIDIKTDCRIQRFHDKKSFLIDVFREEKLIVAISGKNHQIFLFPTIIIEGMNAEPIKIEETKGCNLFCLGKLVKTSSTSDLALQQQQQPQNSIYSSATRLLCVAIKKVVSIYEINSTLKPKYKKLREIELTMNVQSMQIINNQLCIGFQSEFALYSLSQETAPIALLQPDRDKSLQFLIKDPINALLAVQITNEEYLLVFENLGIYVNISGCRSRVEEIMWPSKPLHVAYTDPYLLCFCDRGIDVFHTKTGEWIQILQFAKTKPLDRAGALCLCNESQDSIRLIHLKAIGDEELISLMTKNRSLIKSKFRKGSLSRNDEAYLSLTNNVANTSISGANNEKPSGGSTALNYSNSNASSSNSTSRKSLISNPINFQHIQHIGPSDGKSIMTSDISTAALPPSSGSRNMSLLSNNSTDINSKKVIKQIGKNEISGPTNFRHVVRGLDEFGPTPASNKDGQKVVPTSPLHLSSTSTSNTANNQQQSSLSSSPQAQLPHIQASTGKSSSLSSSSSSSSSIMHSPHSPNSSNTENLSQAISSTLKANSVLYNGK